MSNQLQYHLKIFKSDIANANCIDCNQPNPQFASINNGVLICWNCSLLHDQLGYQISYTRDINLDWDDYLFSFIRHGGNSKFKALLEEYSLQNASVIEKYNSSCADYYRKQLKAKLFAKEAPFKPSIEEGKEPFVPLQDDYPEFANYKFVVCNKIGIEMAGTNSKSFSNQLFDVLNGFGEKFVRQNRVLANIFRRTKIPEKIKLAGVYIADKSKPALNYTKSKLELLKDKLIGEPNENANANQNNNSNINENGNENGNNVYDINANEMDLGAPIESSPKGIEINYYSKPK